MILDLVENLYKYDWLCKDIPAILEKLSDNSLAPGEYPISEQCFIVLQEYETRVAHPINFEAHAIHADIQIMLEGEEVQYYSLEKNLQLSTPFQDNDICFYELEKEDTLQAITLRKGSFTVYLPGECHAPCYDSKGKSKVRKAIVKVKYQK